MADSSFSSTALPRKKHKTKTKASTQLNGEGSDTRGRMPSGPAHTQMSSVTSRAPESTSSSSRRRNNWRSNAESNEGLSPSTRSTASGGSKVQQYIANLNSSTWPPAMVSSSEGSEEETKLRNKGGDARNSWHKNTARKGNGRRKSSLSSDDSEGEDDASSVSDDSVLDSSKKTIDKYRKKYLDVDTVAEQKKTQAPKGKDLKTSSFGNDGSETNNQSYNKYRQRLAENKGSDDKWAAPEKKLGAPPSLEYNYRYKSASPTIEAVNKPAAPPASNSGTKAKKIKLKSEKIAKEDLGILASMLDDNGSDTRSNDGENSHGVFSTTSDDETQYVDGQSTADDDESMGRSDRLQQRQGGTEPSETIDGVSVKSPESSYEEQVVDDGDEEVLEEVIEKTPSRDDRPKKSPLSSRFAKLHNLKKAKQRQDLGSVASPPASGYENGSFTSFGRRKAGISDADIPPNIREDHAEEQADLGNFLDRQISKRKMGHIGKSERSDPSTSHREDDFSALWEQSVDSEARARVGPYVQDDSSEEGSKEIQGLPNPLASKPLQLDKAEEESLAFINDEEGVERNFDPSDSTHEAWNSSTHQYGSSGVIESSERLDASDMCRGNIIPNQKPVSSSNKNQMHLESSSDSDSDDGSLDFDKLTGLEKYTMQGSKNATEQFESQTPVMANKKAPKVDAAPKMEKMAMTDGGNMTSGLLLAKEDSELSLDALNFGREPTEMPNEKVDAGRDDDDQGSMSDFSLNPANDLGNDKSLSEFDKTEYQPQRSTDLSGSADLNQAFQVLDAGSLEDIEAPVDAQSRNSESAAEQNMESQVTLPGPIRKPMYSTGFMRHFGRAWAALVVLAAIALPVYFLLFYNNDENDDLPPLDLFPTPPTFAPTAAPVTPPTLAPMPTNPPVFNAPPTRRPTSFPITPHPTITPTQSRINVLRNFLVTLWPRLQDDFIGFTSAQYFALDWLANNANYEEYTEDQLIQRFALATFYFSTSGDTWRNNAQWLSDEDECTWYSGSSESPCDGNGSYTSLNLDLNDLSGTIPAEVALLSNLSVLDLSKAGSSATLTGTIPSEIGVLVNMVSLSIRGNDIAGSIPSEVGALTDLEDLNLSINRLSGKVPDSFGNMTRLRLVNLEQNVLTGMLPSTIGHATSLNGLRLAQNSITGDIPSEIGNLLLLESIDLNRNEVSSIPTEIGNLILLQRLSIANNLLRGSIPSQLGNLILLISLRLENNSLTGTLPQELGNLIELRDTLDISGNQLTGQIPATFGQLIFLRNLLLHDNLLTGAIPATFAALRRLSVLRLESNNLGGFVSDAVCGVFNATYPVFSADCADPPEIICPCCMFCCEDLGDCSCQYEETAFEFLCADFTRSLGLEERAEA